MAHVLLPCDLPSWPHVQRHLSQLRLASDLDSLMEGMRRIHDICSISLDPDDRPDQSEKLFEPLRRFLEESCAEEERARFLRVTLPCLVNHAMRLRVVRPPEGFHYLLQQEERSVTLDRQFVLSLLANAFFSTFPRRTAKTHPTLQDFNFVQLFQHLETDSQQLKLKSILRYIEATGYDSSGGSIRYIRQVVSPASIPSLPHWLCSDMPLCPLVLRPSGSIEEAEPHVYKACFCSPKVGGDVLREGFSQESRFFSLMPELLVCICFAEALLFNEAIVVQGVRHPTSADETDVCLMDASNFSAHPSKQYDDQALVRELTKCYTAFLQPHLAARLSPVGRSASPTPPPAAETSYPRSSVQSFKTSLPDWDSEEDKNQTELHLKPPLLQLKQQISNCSDIFEDAFENFSFDAFSDSRQNTDVDQITTKLKEMSFSSNLSNDQGSFSFATSSSSLKTGKSQFKYNKSISNSNDKLRHSSGTPTLLDFQKEISRNDSPDSNYKHASIHRMAEENALEISRYQKEMENILNDLAKFSIDFNPKVSISTDNISHRNKPRKLSTSSSRHSELIPPREKRKPTEKSLSKESDCSDYKHKMLKPVKNDQYMRKYSDPLELCKHSQRSPFGTDVPVRKYSDPFSVASRPGRHSSEETSLPESRKCPAQVSTESGYTRSLSRSSSRRKRAEVDPSIKIVESFISELLNHERKKRNLEKRKSRSWGQISQGNFSEDDEYFTADENMSDSELGISAGHRRRLLLGEMPGSQESTGFHLDTDDEISKHERYEDFKKRIRCRTRRRSRRSSSSYLGSSSDMEDISEEDMPECRTSVMRAASSEPNLAGVPLAITPPPTTAPLVPGRRLMMTTYSGQLKAYSYDGVKPNLPVPFKAKFRRRRSQYPDDDSTGGSSLEDLSDNEVLAYNPYRRVESQDSSILPDDADMGYPSVLMPTVEGLKPVAGGKWGCGSRQGGDPQLKVAVQWLAASLALLPSLVVYTGQDLALTQLEQVSRRAEKQGWTVGDLACDTLRYCRSHVRRSSPQRPQLFGLLLGGAFLSHDSLE